MTFQEIMNRECGRDPQDERPLTVDDLKKALAPRPPKPCVVCGEPTSHEFFGAPLCSPYDSSGRRVRECKYVYAERTEGLVPGSYAEPEIPPSREVRESFLRRAIP